MKIKYGRWVVAGILICGFSPSASFANCSFDTAKVLSRHFIEEAQSRAGEPYYRDITWAMSKDERQKITEVLFSYVVDRWVPGRSTYRKIGYMHFDSDCNTLDSVIYMGSFEN